LHKIENRFCIFGREPAGRRLRITDVTKYIHGSLFISPKIMMVCTITRWETRVFRDCQFTNVNL